MIYWWAEHRRSSMGGGWVVEAEVLTRMGDVPIIPAAR
jgi:hypothetical protein